MLGRPGPAQLGPGSVCFLGQGWNGLGPECFPLPPPYPFSLSPGYYFCSKCDGALCQALIGSSSPPRSPAFAQNLSLAIKHPIPSGPGFSGTEGPVPREGVLTRDEMYLEKCLETGAELSSLGLCLRDPE